jgi:hypothetical protein
MKYSKLAKFYLILLVFNLILYETNSVSLAKDIKILKPNEHFKNLKTKRSNNYFFDNIEKCILACTRCSGEDLNVNIFIYIYSFLVSINLFFLIKVEELEQSLSLVCSNDCLISSEPRIMTDKLLSQDIFDKTFTKCFIQYLENPSSLEKLD